MTPQDRIDTGFAPWSLMTPDPAKARATRQHVQTAALVHEDKRAPEMAADDGYMFGDDGLTFGDLLDIVNPLQHLPIVGAVYRSLTGDEAEPGAKLAGGAIYGGPLGFASALLNNAIEEHTGDDILGNVLALAGFDDDGEAGSDGTALADGSSAAPFALGSDAAGSETQLTALASGEGASLQLDPAQAAFLERLAARSAGQAAQPENPGAIAPDEDGQSLDALLTGAQTAGANPVSANLASVPPGKTKDFGGFTKISNEMAQHLAMLAQAGSPGAALAQQAKFENAPPLQSQSAGEASGDTGNQAEMRAASARYSAALPLSISGTESGTNPFAAIEAKQNEPDPFETAMNRLGLNPPTVKTRGTENTERELMKAAFPQTAGQSSNQLANLAASSASGPGITPPPGKVVPSAMLDALNRYQAMKQQG